ncbi:hypothetical protein HMPREF1267_01189 [Corynebacterium sp. KPL1824]|nr:hypothetical protein HMPREF1267_01189 [Corynebacterium sp. KPL1824]
MPQHPSDILHRKTRIQKTRRKQVPQRMKMHRLHTLTPTTTYPAHGHQTARHHKADGNTPNTSTSTKA